jgi:hypothetical protein
MHIRHFNELRPMVEKSCAGMACALPTYRKEQFKQQFEGCSYFRKGETP